MASSLPECACGITPRTYSNWEPVGISFATIATIIVLLRIAARRKLGMKLWWDDYANMGALAVNIVSTAILSWLRTKGFGMDLWAVPQQNINTILKGVLVASGSYVVAQALTRLSILCFCLRIFQVRPAKTMIYYTIVFLAALSIAHFTPTVVQCTPISYTWLRWDGEHHGQCINLRVFVWTTAILAILLDIWLIILPLLYISRLKLPLKKRIFVTSMFAVGIAVLAISIARLPYIDSFARSTNVTIDFVGLSKYSGLEMSVGIICASLPSLPALLKIPSCLKRSSDSKKLAYTTALSCQPEIYDSGHNTGLEMGDNHSGIRMTTSIQQQDGDSELESSLNTVGASAFRQGFVEGRAWA
ncbi:hypothetical protein NPX13_g10376 [Xylaria arbuscula]|uniref:Rhodopsin domain-containing protein n=1 Tax=Xylaria arbuscula TaxID=114810 RepID=A0A9W8N4X4_9PEZI|nr:hypothetical protein NPX13_g10376 [Xylaria arbuscula]